MLPVSTSQAHVGRHFLDTQLSTVYVMITLIFITIILGKNYYLHFMSDKSERE